MPNISKDSSSNGLWRIKTYKHRNKDKIQLKISIMIRSIIKLAVFLVIGILVYNFFLGTETEKESSRRVFTEIKEVGVAITDLLKSEKDKFDEGKYDDALAKIEDAFGTLRSKAREVEDAEVLDKLERLSKERDRLEEQFQRKTKGVPSEFTEKGERVYELSERDKRKMQRELDNLLKDTEQVLEEMELRK